MSHPRLGENAKIVILGNGLIGSQAAERLAQADHEVIALGREAGIDTTTGEGIADAIAGADVVVDLTNSPSWKDDHVQAFFRESSAHLLARRRRPAPRQPSTIGCAITPESLDRVSA